MRGWLFIVALLIPLPGLAAVVQVSAGEHLGFTRLVLQYDTPVNWTLGRTPDGYELRIPGTTNYDLSKVFAQIGKSRLAAIWADPDSSALHVGVGCACFAMPFEFRPGTVVIDLKDGPPPRGSSFELPLDGGITAQLAAHPLIRPKARPGAISASYNWVNVAGPRVAALTPVLPTVLSDTSALALTDPGLEQLRNSLIEQLSIGASAGVVDMTMPKSARADSTKVELPDSSVQIHVGGLPDLVVRQKGQSNTPMTAIGADCINEDRLDVSSWTTGAAVADQIGPALSGLTGEFDRPDHEAIARAIRFDLNIGFGAEARALIRVFPNDATDAAIWQSMARILDGEPDLNQAFAGMAACDTAAALWAVLDDPAILSVDQMAEPAILRSFSALPGRLRPQLGLTLIKRFIAMNDISAATAVEEAVLRTPGVPGPEIELMRAAMQIATGHPEAAIALLQPMTIQSGPASPDSLMALVAQRSELGQPVSFAQVQSLEEYLKERQGSTDEPRYQHALVLALAASGDFDSAFELLPKWPDAAKPLWQSLAKTGPDSALLSHAVLANSNPVPTEAITVAALIADRLLTLGLPDQAARWLDTDSSASPILLARLALVKGDAQTALNIVKPLDNPAAAPLRAEALQLLGAEAGAAAVYAALNQPDQQWSATARARDWPQLASQGPAPWKAATAMFLAPIAATDAPDLSGPLAQDEALIIRSAATRDALDQLLTAVKSPLPPAQ